MISKLLAITKGSLIIDEIFWELLKTLSASAKSYGGSAEALRVGGKSEPLTELFLARQIRKLARAKGAQGMAFPPIVSFGRNAAEIHHSPTSQKIGENNFLMLDYGVRVAGFCSDFTRTLFLGKPNKFHEKIYNTVLKAQETAIRQIKPNVDCYKIDLAARNVIIKAGFGQYYNHHTGHGVGKKIHELPSFSATSPSSLPSSPSSLVMTVEPGIYLPGKFGVRIEDMILISGKPRIFSKVPRDFKSMIVSV